MNRFGTSQVWLNLLVTESSGVPIRQVPISCHPGCGKSSPPLPLLEESITLPANGRRLACAFAAEREQPHVVLVQLVVDIRGRQSAGVVTVGSNVTRFVLIGRSWP
jgi:hypothetical protein